MTFDQFTAMLDRYGSQRDQWPAAERAAAERLVATMPQAAAALAEATRIDRLMRAFDPGREVGEDAVIRLSNLVLANLPPQQVRRHPWWRAALDHFGTALGAGREWGPRVAVSIAAAAILGVVTGDLLPTDDPQISSAVEMLAMSNTYLPLDAR
ncbi:MAG: hypothetical protein ACM31D_15505 [Bacteroidota bacterium]